MSEQTLIIKEALSHARPVIKSVVDIFIAPKLQKIKSNIDAKNNKSNLLTETHFSEYYYRTYKKFSIANTLVFHNSQKLLKDIFIPLTIINQSNKQEHYKIEGYNQQIINKHKKILITDTAGMGKSTVVKRVFLDTIDKSIGIPIIIELRRLNKEKKIIDEIIEQLSPINNTIDCNILYELINEGDFIFFLDGYDEISISDRDSVTNDIQNFISKAGLNTFFLTSRPESALVSFGDFQQFKIEPLSKQQAHELIRKYNPSGNLSKLLIKKLEESNYQSIDEFLTNPLLVSLLFAAFEYKQVIPIKKHIFYRQVFDANFESHDLTKGESYIHQKYSNLSIDDFHRVLRHIGFSCLKLQKIEFNKDEILVLIKKAQNFCVGITFNESDFLKDLIVTVPLFTQDGIYYKWSHKSLQEYFAAQFIYLDAKDQQTKILTLLYNSSDIENYYNTFDLYYDIDYKTFRNVIIYDILKKFIKYYDDSFKDFDYIKEKDLQIRKLFNFWGYHVIIKEIKSDPLNNKNYAKAINIASAKLKAQAVGFRHLLHPSEEENLILCYYDTPKKTLLNLLANKNNELIINDSRDKGAYLNYKGYEPFIKNAISMQPLYTHDVKDSICNAPEYFSLINELLLEYKILTPLINPEKAVKELEEIKKNISEENKKDFLLEGLS